MAVTLKNITELQAINEHINIGLFNDAATFIVKASQANNGSLRLSAAVPSPLFVFSENENIQERFGVRYLGELLERYDERIEAGPRDVRAIALAVALTRNILSGDMFVGSQRADYIRKIRRLSENDIYLKGALYLLDNDAGRGALYDELTSREYTRLEELAVVLSLFEDFERAFKVFKPQLLKLLCGARNIPVMGNTGLFGWLLKKLEPIAKTVKTKDMALFRALLALPVTFVKPGDRRYVLLTENGYTRAEILYLSVALIESRLLRDSLNADSVVTEKIVVELFESFLNSEDTHEPAVYEQLSDLLRRYKDFRIKCNGARTLFEALEGKITLKNADTFSWLYGLIKAENVMRDVFSFDITDCRWDALAMKLPAESYRALFDRQIEFTTDLGAEELRAWIGKYDELSGDSYLDGFYQADSNWRGGVFTALADKGIIDVSAVFRVMLGSETAGTTDNPVLPVVGYIRNYVKGAHSRKAFEFFRDALQRLSFAEIEERLSDKGHWNSSRFDFSEKLFQRDYGTRRRFGSNYVYDYVLEVKRDFLTDEEHLLLLGWLEEYVFLFRPTEYENFAVAVLWDEFVSGLLPQRELRALFDAVRKLNSEDLVKTSVEHLSKKYLTAEELSAEAAADREREEEAKRRVEQEERREIQDKFGELFDGTFKSIAEYVKKHGSHYFQRHKRMAALETARQAFAAVLKAEGYVPDAGEAACFFSLCGDMLADNAITLAEAVEYAERLRGRV